MKTIFQFLSLSFGIIVVGLIIYLFHGSGNNESLTLLVQPGSSLGEVAQILGDKKVISDPILFKYLLRFTGGKSRMRAGEFEFLIGMRPLDALRTLYFGKPIEYSVTVPEGWTATQIAKILSDKELTSTRDFLDIVLSKSGAEKYHLTTPHLEGFLFPDTYSFSKVDGTEKIVDRMVKRFFQTYKKYEYEAKAQGFTPEKLATFASIVEKESGVDSERPMIASVFFNRLKKGMRLQSDPTTIYGISDFSGNLTKQDLRTPSPYNTYTLRGLPIGPIANPGEAAILATLRPAQTSYLYFVSKNNGEHIFSETYREHASHVDNFQKKLTKRKTGKK